MVQGASAGRTIIADKAYEADVTREAIAQAGCEDRIPAKANRWQPVAHDPLTFAKRHVVENFWEMLKRRWRIATRYEKLAI